MLNRTQEWFAKAVPTPTAKNLVVQVSVHTEEFGEFLDELVGLDWATLEKIVAARTAIANLTAHLRAVQPELGIRDREGLLDSLADQIVTAVGVGHMAGMKVPEALQRVNDSNWSKFDSNGNPIFSDKGKILKGEGYFKPDLTGLY